MKTEGDLRILGARDGYLHALVEVKMKIQHIEYRPINPRHTRKRAEREMILAPLKELADRLHRQMTECLEAWENTRKDAA